VVEIVWIPWQGRLVTHTADNSLQLWQIDHHVGSYRHARGQTEDLLQLMPGEREEEVAGGDRGGNIYQLVLRSFTFNDEIIYQDVLDEKFKLNPGAVEASVEHPTLSGDRLCLCILIVSLISSALLHRPSCSSTRRAWSTSARRAETTSISSRLS